MPSDDPRSNELLARKAFLDHVPIPLSQIHPIHCELDPDEAARLYENDLRDFFHGVPPSFDLVFLGLGEDGHTASLFSGSPVIHERKRWVKEVFVPTQDLPRVTLTPHLINMADSIVFLVSGSNKAKILKQVLEGPQTP